MTQIQKKLFELRDSDYAAFQAKLTPGIAPEKMIGVRIPVLRGYAAELLKNGSAEAFLQQLPHDYYDENMLHALLVSREKDPERAFALTDAFLPYVDNWAVCDILSPRAFAKCKGRLLEKAREWIASEKVYTCRFGMEMLMTHFLDEDFFPEILDMVASVHSGEYYVRMMAAWFFATALSKQWDATAGYLVGRKLDAWTHNMTIRKARESYRITEEQKQYLSGLKIGAKVVAGIPVGFGWRRAGWEDEEAVSALYRSVIGDGFCTWTDGGEDPDPYPGKIEYRKDMEEGELWLLTDMGAPVGAASIEWTRELDDLPLWKYRDEPVEFARVAVSPLYRGRGLGARIVRAVEITAASEGAKVVHLLAAMKNLPARATYRRLGYEERGQVRMFGEDYMALEKKL